jgi:putative ABC transport system permease protein
LFSTDATVELYRDFYAMLGKSTLCDNRAMFSGEGAFSVNTLRIGFFLAVRQMRANMGTTVLIIVVMALTFLDLLVVSGLMVGIVQGLRSERQHYYTGDIFLANFQNQTSIANSPFIIDSIRHLPEVEAVAPRYVMFGQLEANYQTIVDQNKLPDSVSSAISGINPKAEDATTDISKLIADGEYLAPDDYDGVLIGSSLLAQYKQFASLPGWEPISNVHVGDKVRILVNGNVREMTVRGILGVKDQELTLRIFMNSEVMRDMLGRKDSGVNEIAVRLKPGTNPTTAKKHIKNIVDGSAKVELPRETEASFIQDFAATFQQLGTLLGGIGLIVAFITIFILVFINTITRRRYIGILQAIGVTAESIEMSYILQSLVYATCGVTFGLIVVYGLLEPYFFAHPIDFPFSNGVLSIPILDAIARGAVLVISILFASYFPARMIMRRNLVDSILGR